jgi:hypothetical protein
LLYNEQAGSSFKALHFSTSLQKARTKSKRRRRRRRWAAGKELQAMKVCFIIICFIKVLHLFLLRMP